MVFKENTLENFGGKILQYLVILCILAVTTVVLTHLRMPVTGPKSHGPFFVRGIIGSIITGNNILPCNSPNQSEYPSEPENADFQKESILFQGAIFQVLC